MSFFRRAGALIARFFTSAADPAAVAGEFKLYSKDDTSSESQLYGRSDNGTVYQITPPAVGGSQCLIFKPGSGETGSVVFDTWAGLYTRLTTLRAQANSGGCYTIQFDPSAAAIDTDLTIPAGVYDMSDVAWEGTSIGVTGIGGPPTLVYIAEGATFTGGPLSFERVAVRSQATTTPPFTYTGNPFGTVIQIRNHARIEAETSPIPVFRVSGGSFVVFYIADTSFGDGANPVLEVNAGSAANLQLGVGADVGENALITTGDGSIGGSIAASSAQITDNQPLAAGYAGLTLTTDIRHNTEDIQGVDSDVYVTTLNRFDGFTDPLPQAQLPQALLSNNRYKWVLIKETSGQPSSSGTGDLGITINPFAGDTIDGVLGPLLLLPGAQVALISDGVGAWNSAFKTASVPEKVFASVVIDSSGGVEKRIAYFNVGSVAKNGTGDWTITFNNPFPMGYFPVVTTGLRDQGLVFVNYNTIDNSNIQILAYNAAGVLTDPNYINVVVHLAPEIID